MIGLIPDFLLMLWDVHAWGRKGRPFFHFQIAWVTAALSFAKGHSSLRMFLARPEPYKLAAPPKALAFGVPALWVRVILMLIGLPLLANRTRSGWWLALIASRGMLIGNRPLYLQHSETKVFLVGIFYASLALAALLLPKIVLDWIAT